MTTDNWRQEYEDAITERNGLIDLKMRLQAEIDRLRARVQELERQLHPSCNCPRCTGLPDYYTDDAALDVTEGDA